MKQFLKRLMGFSLGPILGAGISFILFPIFTNSLSVGEYGIGAGFQTILLQIPSFIYMGMDQAYTREYHHQEDKRDLMQQAMVLPLILGLLISVLALTLSSQLSNWFFRTPEYNYIIVYAAIWVMFTVVERFVLLTIRMQEKALEYSSFSLLQKILNFVVSMTMIFMGIRNLKVIVYGLIFGHLLADVIMFIRYRDLLDIRAFKLDPKLIKLMFIFGLPIMIATSLAAILNSIDTIFLTNFSTSENLGVYQAGSKIGAIIGILKTAFASFWVPTAYRWYEEGKSMKHYKYISDMILFIMSAMYFILLLIKQPLALFLSPDGEFIEVMYIIGLLAFPNVMYTLSETTNLGIVFSRKTHYNIIVSGMSLLVSFSMNMALTPSWGYRGAALASTSAYIIFYLARTYYSSKTGFYFGQSKQVVTMILMVAAGVMNMFPIPYVIIYTLIMAVIALIVQLETIKTTVEIKNNSSEWDFS